MCCSVDDLKMERTDHGKHFDGDGRSRIQIHKAEAEVDDEREEEEENSQWQVKFKIFESGACVNEMPSCAVCNLWFSFVQFFFLLLRIDSQFSYFVYGPKLISCTTIVCTADGHTYTPEYTIFFFLVFYFAHSHTDTLILPMVRRINFMSIWIWKKNRSSVFRISLHKFRANFRFRYYYFFFVFRVWMFE